MKKYFGLLLLFLTISTQAQSFAKQFDVKEYAVKQTDKIQSALDLPVEMKENILKANTFKAHSVQKFLILFEQEGRLEGMNLKEAIKTVEGNAEKASGYLENMKNILGDELYNKFLEKLR